MSKLLKQLGLALTALIIPTLGWANPTPVLLVNFGGTADVTATSADDSTKVDTWKALSQNSVANSSTTSITVGNYTVEAYFTGGGKMWAGTWGDTGDATYTFASGDFSTPDETASYSSILTEMKNTLGLNAEVPEAVYRASDYSGNSGDRTSEITVSGLTSGTCYTLYVMSGIYMTSSNGSNTERTPEFELVTYDSSTTDAPVVSYALHSSTSYAEGTTSITSGTAARDMLVVRVHNLYPTDGVIKFKAVENRTGFNVLALAETDYIPPYGLRTLDSTAETWSEATKWSRSTVPGADDAVELTVTSAEGSTLTLDADATIDQLTIAGDYALTFAGDDTLAVTTSTTINADTNVSAITANLGAVTVASGKSLTIGATTVWTSISGEGTLIADNCTLDLTGSTLTDFKGTYALQNGATLKLTAGAEEGLTIPAGCTLQVVYTTTDLAYTPTATGEGTIQVVDADGTVISGEDGTFTPALSGKGTWYEYLFEANPEGTANNGGHLPNTGTSSAGMRGEDAYTWTFVDVGQTGRKAAQIYPKCPWTTTSPTFNSLETWSASFFAKMPTTEGGVLMGFGTTQNANGFIALVRGKGENKVLLVSGGASSSTQRPFNILADFTVPNAETAYHLYTFVRTATGVEIYLDGEPWTPYNQTVTVGDGFQIGSLHGGFGSGGFVYSGELTDYTGLTLARGGSATDTSGAVDMLRIYRRALTAADVQTLAAEYTYVSPNGSYSRTIDADATWIGDDDTAWTNDGDATTVAEPPTGSVTVTTTANAKVSMNLTEAKTFEALTLQGSGVTLIGEEGSAVASVTGLTKVLCDATIDCGVVEMTGPVRVADGATLTLDASNAMLETMLDGKVVGTYTHHLTGPVTVTGSGRVVPPTGLTYEGWDVTVAQDDTNAWVLTASRANLYFVIAEDGSFSWKAGNSLETASEISSIPTDSLSAPIYVIANADGYVALPNGTTPSVTISGTNTVQLWLASWATDAQATVGTLTVEDTATVLLVQNVAVTVNETTIADTASIAYSATEEGWSISNWLSGSYGIRVATGTLILSGLNGDYNGTITVDEDATLESTGSATVPFGKGSIVNNGTLNVGGTNGQLPPVSGTGDININAETRIAGDITTTGTLTINATATMTYGSDFPVETLTIAGPSIALNYALNTSSEASTVKVVSGKTISGVATINGTLTLDAGAIVKPTDGAAVSVYGVVTLPEEGTITVDATEQTSVLTYIGTAPEAPESIFVTEADNLHAVAISDTMTVTVKLVNVTAPTVDETITDEIAAKAVQAVVDYLTVNTKDSDKTVSAISNPETLSVITDASGVTLTDNDDGTHTATLTYDFGVSEVNVDGDYVIVTVKLGEGLDFAEGASVTLVTGDDETTDAVAVDENGDLTLTPTGPTRYFKTSLTSPFKVKAKATK